MQNDFLFLTLTLSYQPFCPMFHLERWSFFAWITMDWNCFVSGKRLR